MPTKELFWYLENLEGWEVFCFIPDPGTDLKNCPRLALLTSRVRGRSFLIPTGVSENEFITMMALALIDFLRITEARVGDRFVTRNHRNLKQTSVVEVVNLQSGEFLFGDTNALLRIIEGKFDISWIVGNLRNVALVPELMTPDQVERRDLQKSTLRMIEGMLKE